VSERCLRAADAAVSAVLLRVVGTGGSLATNWGCTVRCGVAVVVVAGLAAVEVLVVLVVLVAAGLGAVAYAAKMRDEEKLRCCIRLAIDGTLDDEAEIRAETPLRAGVAAMVDVQGWVGLI
jgi:Flp pilus assembly protein TadB